MTTDNSAPNLPQTYDGQTLEPEDTPARIPVPLSRLRDVRLEMASVYRAMKRKEIPAQEGTRLVYVLRSIADVLEIEELERRIEELEERSALVGNGQLLPRAAAH